MKKHTCPYWEATNRCCLLVQDGLFLPVEQHIATYCESRHYFLCRRYELLADNNQQPGKSAPSPDNRRRSVRIPSRHHFRYSEITGSDQIPSFREDDAWTIDLSDHGIRFVTRQQLPLQTNVYFEVEADSAPLRMQGTGRVIWVQPLENMPLFHAAIAFVK